MTELANLFAETEECTRCALSSSRASVCLLRQATTWPHDRTVRLCFIGDGPTEADEAGTRPFSGVDWNFLARMIKNIRVPLEEIHMTHIVACRPFFEKDGRVEDRPPSAGEIRACAERLAAEIRIVDPILLVLFGEKAVRALTPLTAPVSQIVGRWAVVNLPWEDQVLSYPAIIPWPIRTIARTDPAWTPNGPARATADLLRHAARVTDVILALRSQVPIHQLLPSLPPRGTDVSAWGNLEIPHDKTP